MQEKGKFCKIASNQSPKLFRYVTSFWNSNLSNSRSEWNSSSKQNLSFKCYVWSNFPTFDQIVIMLEIQV